MSLLMGALALFLSIVWHELGHLIAGLLTKTSVKAFSVGFGPYASVKFKGIEWRLGLIPLGGYVAFNDDKESANHLENKKLHQRLFIYAAGPLFNVVAALMIIAALVFTSTQSDFGFIESLAKSYEITVLVITETLKGLAGIFYNFEIDKLSGPVGNVHILQSVYEDNVRLFWLGVAVVNVGMAVFNLLPLPILDGGHIISDLISWVTKINIKETAAHQYAALSFTVAIVCLFVFITYNDIARLTG